MADDNSLYLAGGSKIFNEMQSSDEQKNLEKEQTLRDKSSSISNIKSIAETQGSKPLSTENIASAIGAISTTLANRINQMSITTAKQFLPIDSQIKQVNDLLSSNTEGDIDAGFALIDKLQSRLGVDLGKYSKEIGDAVKKLYDMNSQRNADKAENKRIQVEKTQELIIERDILREKGINTYINEKTLVLEMKSKKEEKAEVRRIEKEAKDLLKEKDELSKEAKLLQKQDTITAEQQEKYLIKQENLAEKEKINKRDAERANIKPPNERISGPLDQTVGEAFRQIKTFGKEIKQLGGDLFKGFTSLIKGTGKLIMGFFTLLLNMLPFIIIVTLIGVALFALYKVVKSVIDFFGKIFDAVMNTFPFSLLKSEEGDEKDKKLAKDETDKQRGVDTVTGEKSVERVPAGTLQNRSDVMKSDKAMVSEEPDEVADDVYRNTGFTLINRVPGRKLPSTTAQSITPIPKEQSLNEITMQNRAAEEKSSKSANNTVIAPNISNSSVSGSQTSVMSLDPVNNDRSFINLNSVPV